MIQGSLSDSHQTPSLTPISGCLMSDYELRPGGSLKLKGGVAEGGIKKK